MGATEIIVISPRLVLSSRTAAHIMMGATEIITISSRLLLSSRTAALMGAIEIVVISPRLVLSSRTEPAMQEHEAIMICHSMLVGRKMMSCMLTYVLNPTPISTSIDVDVDAIENPNA